jgi:hypothetical protein
MRLSTIFSDLTKSDYRRGVLVCAAAAALALAPQSAFAQHGGGGGMAGGGGGHAGGGGMSGGGFGGGGGRAGSGSSGGARGGSSAPSGNWSGGASHGSEGSRGSAPASGNVGNSSNGGGHWWSGIFGGGHGSKASASEKTATNHGAERSDGVVMHDTWKNPPTEGTSNFNHAIGARPSSNLLSVPNNRTFAFLQPGASGARPAVLHGRWGRNYYPPTYFYYWPPYYYGYDGYGYGYGGGYFWNSPCNGLGFGWGLGFSYGWADPLWSGWASNCDPTYGFGYGYDNFGVNSTAGADSGGNYTIDASGQTDSGSTTGGSSQDQTSTSNEPPAVARTNGNSGGTAASQNAQPFVLFMKDGSSYAVTDYWLAGGKLHYVTSYGGENTVDLSRLDIQKTVDENAAEGRKFALRSGPLPAPKPAATPETGTEGPSESTAPQR